METIENGVTRSVRFRSGAVGSKLEIKAIKLELGSQQTLAHKENDAWVLNEIPNYSEQLIKCQRYYLSPAGTKSTGYVEPGTNGYIRISTPVKMRTIPSVSVISVNANLVWNNAVVPMVSVQAVSVDADSVTLQFQSSVASPVFQTVCNATAVFALNINYQHP